VKVDARSERWREHRKKVRSEIVDAAFRAIDRLGPEVSLREIAEEAGTAKPKIYRHFTDKSDLFQAIGERLRDILWAAIFPTINLATDPAREVIRRSVEQYVLLVDEHHEINLDEVLRQNILTNLPLRALCNAACPGLCSTCGQRLDLRHTAHAELEADEPVETPPSPFARLAVLLTNDQER